MYRMATTVCLMLHNICIGGDNRLRIPHDAASILHWHKCTCLLSCRYKAHVTCVYSGMVTETSDNKTQ